MVILIIVASKTNQGSTANDGTIYSIIQGQLYMRKNLDLARSHNQATHGSCTMSCNQIVLQGFLVR